MLSATLFLPEPTRYACAPSVPKEQTGRPLFRPFDLSPCESGVRIKPGARAPGSRTQISSKPVKRATAQMFALSPTRRAPKYFLFRDPGARAPGFMLTPASQVKKLSLYCLGDFGFDWWFLRRDCLAAHAGEELFVFVYNVVPGVVSLDSLLGAVSVSLDQ